MIYFTSDTHFGHANVIGYCKRPFADVHEMNRELIRRWNERVAPTDIVYHLGDLHMGPRSSLMGLRQRLNGHVILVLGNHDRSATAMRDAGFDPVKSATITIGAVTAHLRHIPPRMGETLPLADIYLCGHVHEAWAQRDDGPGGRPVINVGVDVRDFRPVTLRDLIGQS